MEIKDLKVEIDVVNLQETIDKVKELVSLLERVHQLINGLKQPERSIDEFATKLSSSISNSLEKLGKEN